MRGPVGPPPYSLLAGRREVGRLHRRAAAKRWCSGLIFRSFANARRVSKIGMRACDARGQPRVSSGAPCLSCLLESPVSPFGNHIAREIAAAKSDSKDRQHKNQIVHGGGPYFGYPPAATAPPTLDGSKSKKSRRTFEICAARFEAINPIPSHSGARSAHGFRSLRSSGITIAHEDRLDPRIERRTDRLPLPSVRRRELPGNHRKVCRA
jgi:hypothetical protein